MSDDGIRRSLIEGLSRRVRVIYHPRVGMSLILIITFAGMHFSTILLHHYGWHDMWLRYLLTCAAGYLLFLLCLYIWTHSDIHELGVPDTGSSNGSCAESAGANDTTFAFSEKPSTAAGKPEVSVADGVASMFEEVLGPLLILGLIIFAVFGFIWVLFLSSAHMLLAELIFDAGLTGAIYQSMRGVAPQGWLRTAVRRTLPIFAFITFIMVGAGYYVSKHIPGATTLGEAYLLAREAALK